jgi:hypothetical protein
VGQPDRPAASLSGVREELRLRFLVFLLIN